MPRAVVIAAAALLVGCGGGGDAPEAEAEAGPGLDPIAFSRTAETVDGEQVELAGFRDRDLVVWFWAPW